MTDWTTARVTPEMLAELRRLAEAATPGPWYLDGPWWYGDDDSAYCISTAEDAGRIAVTIAPPRYIFGGEREVRDANARFIAAANPAVVLALLDRLAHMREARDAARAEVKRLTALVEAVREYAAARQANIDHGPLLSAQKAAHDALLAALARLDASADA